MQNRFDIGTAPMPPLRAEARPTARDAEGHIRGVTIGAPGLIRATLGAAVAGTAILVLAWLPAEYGIDLTGLGRVTGLTEMGEIKQQLYAEAAAEDAAKPAPAAAPASTDPQVLERLTAIEAQLSAIAALIGAAPAVPAPAAVVQQAAPVSAASAVAEPAAPVWRDSWSYTLQPGDGIEAKLKMTEGAQAEFDWTASGGVLNHDMHGDGSGKEISYEQGRGVPGQAGVLTAAFTGNHGWFWRNRTDAPVTMTLHVRGEYERLLTP
ncbi:hypothetical protein [Thioclava sp. L04-15]|uniref:hypothetical protein n=1 Tax=Thioclava sp. L04-15 TaxID=1915318 RepID=UPI000996CF78|nr:hypothetical protein [Thioclava sp. L04-15]TNE93574.1 MAG: hypothetical protein EP337_02985 [Paracoccaceae bacterium]